MPMGFFKTLANDFRGDDTVWRCSFNHGFSGNTSIKIMEDSGTLKNYATIAINLNGEKVFRQQYDMDEFLKLLDTTIGQLQTTATEIRRFMAEPPPQFEKKWGRE